MQRIPLLATLLCATSTLLPPEAAATVCQRVDHGPTLESEHCLHPDAPGVSGHGTLHHHGRPVAFAYALP